jgi:hypothetical protein
METVASMDLISCLLSTLGSDVHGLRGQPNRSGSAGIQTHTGYTSVNARFSVKIRKDDRPMEAAGVLSASV